MPLTRPTRLILVHGTRFDAHQWDGYAERIPTADVTAVDLPGHGSRVGQQWTLENALAVLDDEIRSALDQGHRVVLAGHSLGGYLATAYAHRHPDKIDALVVIGATADPSRHRRLTRIYTIFGDLPAKIGPERTARWSNAVMRALGARTPLPDAAGYAVTPDAWASVISVASVDQLNVLECPVFLVVGQFDQMRIDLRAYADANPYTRCTVIPGATHLAPLTHRDEVVAVLLDAVTSAT